MFPDFFTFIGKGAKSDTQTNNNNTNTVKTGVIGAEFSVFLKNSLTFTFVRVRHDCILYVLSYIVCLINLLCRHFPQ